MKVRLISKTAGFIGTEYEGKSIDEILVGIARISSSREVNELFDEPAKLLRHCITNGHWSVFTMANLTFEVVTSRAIGRQLLRHWSLKPQELSERYAKIQQFEPVELRKQCKNNRQSSTEPITNRLIIDTAENHLKSAQVVYNALLNEGVSRETARFLLPETAESCIIFNGTVRDWITTLNQRLHKTSQLEVQKIAEAIKEEFVKQCPIVAEALYNFEDAQHIHILDRVVLEKYGVYSLIKENNYKKLS